MTSEKAKQINEELNELRKARAKTLSEMISAWNPDKDDIKQLVLTLEELRGSPEGYGRSDVLKTLKSSRTQKDKIKIVKNAMKRAGGNYLIVDKNGFCLTDVDSNNPFDDPADEPILIEHIDDVISYWVTAVEEAERDMKTCNEEA